MIKIGPKTPLCRVCLKSRDLRLGACFDCADLVSGRQLDNRKHELWETAKPKNRWVWSEFHQ